MAPINKITKLLTKQQGWKSLIRSEIKLDSLAESGIFIPKDATCAFKITGKRVNRANVYF